MRKITGADVYPFNIQFSGLVYDISLFVSDWYITISVICESFCVTDIKPKRNPKFGMLCDLNLN